MLGEGFRDRGRWRDRIPGANRGPAIDRAEARGIVARDEDAVAHLVGAGDLQLASPGKMFAHMIEAELEGLHVLRNQFGALLELFAQKRLHHRRVDVEKGGQRADIDDVLEQLPLARVLVGAVADFGQRHADAVHILTEFRRRQRLGRIVQQITTRLDRGDILVPGLRVHRHHQVHTAAPAKPAFAGNPHLIPGGKALDVGREDVARGDGHAHTQDTAGEQFVGTGRTGAVDVGELDDEIVRRL